MPHGVSFSHSRPSPCSEFLKKVNSRPKKSKNSLDSRPSGLGSGGETRSPIHAQFLLVSLRGSSNEVIFTQNRTISQNSSNFSKFVHFHTTLSMFSKRIWRSVRHLWLPALFIERAKHLHKPHRTVSLARAFVLFLSRTRSRFLSRSVAFLFSCSLAPSFSFSLSLSHTHTHMLGAITLILMHSDSD